METLQGIPWVKPLICLWGPYRTPSGQSQNHLVPAPPGKVLGIQMMEISGLVWAPMPLPLDLWSHLSPNRGSGTGELYQLNTFSQL